jgi:hypothetical protein
VEQSLAPSIQQLAIDGVVFTFSESPLWYWGPAFAALLLLLAASLLGSGPRQEAPDSRLRSSDLLYLLAVAVFLIALRWPVLAPNDLEGDESATVSAALTRYLEPSYGLGLFTGSAGPLLSYAVSGLGLLGLKIDYGASRLVALLLMLASTALLYLTLRTFSEARMARIALLPLLVLFGRNVPWTVSYCSEHWINLLLISMIYFLVRLDRRIGREAMNLCGIGLALGLMPLVKWQGMPMAALIVACAIAVLAHRRLRERGVGGAAAGLLPLAALGLAPLLVWCAVLWSHGSLGFFFDTYFAALFSQATSRYPSTLVERFVALPEWILERPVVRAFVPMSLLFTLSGAALLCFVQRTRRWSLEIGLAALYLAVSIYAVIQPGGRFPHYLNLPLQAYALLFMLIFLRLAQALPRPALLASAYLVFTLLLPTIGRLPDFSKPPTAMRWETLKVRQSLLDMLSELRVAGSPMILWGWELSYYVLAGTTWGTRTGSSHEILEPFFPDKSIFIADYLASLESGRAPIFLDTAAEGAYFYKSRARYGHEQVPEIAEAVRRNYFLCADFRGPRLFLNREHYRGRAEIESRCALRDVLVQRRGSRDRARPQLAVR